MHTTRSTDKRKSPTNLRDEFEVLEPYQSPKVLVRQANVDQSSEPVSQQALPNGISDDKSAPKSRKTWLSKLAPAPKTQQVLKRKLSKQIARLSSLDSTRSSSSIEDQIDHHHHNQHQQQQHTMPLISITSNDSPAQETKPMTSATSAPKSMMAGQQASVSSASQLRADYYRNYYGRSSHNYARGGSGGKTGSGGGGGRSGHGWNQGEDDDDDDDDDAFGDAPLPMPYSSSSMARTVVVRQQTDKGVSYPSKSGIGSSPYRLSHYEELLDDRQGMNNSEQHFTKAEKQANRASIDGSIVSESRVDLKKMSGSGGGGGTGASASGLLSAKMSATSGSHKRDKRRSKSPNSMFSAAKASSSSRRQSRRGFLGLASRLKLTKKHESIAKLQLSILNSGFVSLKTLDRDLQSFLPKERLSVREFQERVKLMRKFEVLSTIEYRFASKYETYVCKHAQQETNQPKNNYKKCIPYDYNRVVLKTLPNVPDSDYINASHVDSCLKPNAYIAAQGPNENTIEDFWRMIWEQKTFVIVMLTKVFDFIRVMCNQYWPVELNKPERYGSIEVTLLYEEPLADFVIRTIKVSKLKANQADANNASPAISNLDQVANDSSLARRLSADRIAPDANATILSESEDDYLDNYSDDETCVSPFELDDDADDNENDGTTNWHSANGLVDLNELHGHSLTVRAPKFGPSPTARSRRSVGGRERTLPPRELRARKMVEQTNSHNELNGIGGGANIGSSEYGAENADQLSSVRLNRSASALPGGGGGGGGGVQMRVTYQVDETTTAAAADSCELRDGAGQQQIAGLQRPKSQPQTTNEFLHPLFNASQLTASLNSLSSEPNTPLTPRTPSSAGLDRSSATRKAVKKKRRERIKNQRPRRTHFMVPTESQLQDDDDDGDDDIDDLIGTGSGSGGRGIGSGTSPLADTPGLAGASRNNERIIYQFHYNSWASHTCPFISSLLHFRRRVRICMDEMSKSGKTGPTVVHCNDGCGRTGAYLGIDANLELADEDNVLDIYNYTKKMRQSRKFLIENLEQYKFVYDTIEEAIYCGKTWFPVSELHKRLKHKSQRNPMTRKNEYLLEYEKICQMTSKFSIGDCAGGHRVENREKNRDVSTVPPDNFRPYLTSFQTNDSTDYINAVFVDGYTRSKEYIVTEWPLHKTISDFWSLVYDHDCNSVILLANPGESTTYPSFLPSEKELRRKFGPVFSAEMVSYTHYQNIKSWIYTINKKIVSLTEVIAGVKSETKTTQVFQITCWPQGHRVPTSTNALVELMNMVERWRQRTTYGPVCVVSLNGKSRAGVYCAANVAIEQVVQHSEVDVFNAVKTVRRHRPQLIENMTEYKYCYDLILHYVLHYVNNQSATST